jgi:hypothetical protein
MNKLKQGQEQSQYGSSEFYIIKDSQKSVLDGLNLVKIISVESP